jgi:hypothetical protein
VTFLRQRTDLWWDAGRWRAILLGAVPDPRLDPSVKWHQPFLHYLDDHEEAKIGDVWVFRTCPTGPKIRTTYQLPTADDAHWPVTHYGLVCPVPNCQAGVHVWHHAYDCPAGDTFGADCKRAAAATPGGSTIRKRGSCWDWTGSVEGGDLTASPSLQVIKNCAFADVSLTERTFGPVPCPHGDALCPCQDGDSCHYEGRNPMDCPTFGTDYHCHVEGCEWDGDGKICGLAKLGRTWVLCQFRVLRNLPVEWPCGAARNVTSDPDTMRVLTHGPVPRVGAH